MAKATAFVGIALVSILLVAPVLASTHTTAITLQQGLSGYAGCTDAWLDAGAP